MAIGQKGYIAQVYHDERVERVRERERERERERKRERKKERK